MFNHMILHIMNRELYMSEAITETTLGIKFR